MADQPFRMTGATLTLSASNSSSRVNVSANQVRIYNAGAQTTFVAFGDSTIAATTSDMPVPPGNTEIFTMLTSHTHVAGITASSTATVYCTPGTGE